MSRSVPLSDHMTVSDIDRMLSLVLSAAQNPPPPPTPNPSPPTHVPSPGAPHSASKFTTTDTAGYSFGVKGVRNSLGVVPQDSHTAIFSHDVAGCKTPMVIESFVAINGPGDPTKALKVYGQLQSTDRVTCLAVDANDIGSGASRIRFTPSGIVFDGPIPAIQRPPIEKVLVLGCTSPNAIDGIGIISHDRPLNSKNTNASMLWRHRNGLFNPDGTVVSAPMRSSWELSGGNFTIKGDEGYDYMFAIEGGCLSIYRTDVSGKNELVTRFGKA